MNEDKLEQLFQQFISQMPNISERIIEEIITTSCECTNFEQVVYLLEITNSKIWPRCRPLIIRIIDEICHRVNIRNKPKMIKAISLRLNEIMSKILQCNDDEKSTVLEMILDWKKQKLFDLNLCEEIHCYLKTSMFSDKRYDNSMKDEIVIIDDNSDDHSMNNNNNYHHNSYNDNYYNYSQQKSNERSKQKENENEIIEIDDSSDDYQWKKSSPSNHNQMNRRNSNNQQNHYNEKSNYSQSRRNSYNSFENEPRRRSNQKDNRNEYYDDYYYSRDKSRERYEGRRSPYEYSRRNDRYRDEYDDKNYNRNEDRHNDRYYNRFDERREQRNEYRSRSNSRRRYDREYKDDIYRENYQNERKRLLPKIVENYINVDNIKPIDKLIEESKKDMERKKQQRELRKQQSQLNKFKAFHEIRENNSYSSISEDETNFFSKNYQQHSNSQRNSNNDLNDNQNHTYQRPSKHIEGYEVYYPLKSNYLNERQRHLLQQEKELDEIQLRDSSHYNQFTNKTVLVKSNCIIFCNIPHHWKTKKAVQSSFKNIPMNFIRLLPDHNCCLISFEKHNDALKYKVKPPENSMGTAWGKENWMRKYFMNYDGVVEIPKNDIPPFIKVFNDGSYEFID